MKLIMHHPEKKMKHFSNVVAITLKTRFSLSAINDSLILTLKAQKVLAFSRNFFVVLAFALILIQSTCSC